MVLHDIRISEDKIRDFCRRNQIRKLALFGSILTDRFGAESDVDVLVEFEPEARVGFFKLLGLEEELAEMLGHKVDLNTQGFLSSRVREQAVASAEVLYADGAQLGEH
jgi:predicted nucleotidyltransferase